MSQESSPITDAIDLADAPASEIRERFSRLTRSVFQTDPDPKNEILQQLFADTQALEIVDPDAATHPIEIPALGLVPLTLEPIAPRSSTPAAPTPLPKLAMLRNRLARPTQRRSVSLQDPTSRNLPLAPTYYRAVDGLRGFAVLSVLSFGLGPNNKSLFSIELIFLLSGFFVTLELLRTQHEQGFVHPLRLYLARIKQVVPMMLVTLGLALLVVFQFGSQSELERFNREVGSAFLFSSNWQQIDQISNQVDVYNRLSPISHLWIIAVIEQFVLFWALLLALIFGARYLLVRLTHADSIQPRWQWRPTLGALVGIVSLVGGLLASVAMSANANGSVPERLYFGTDAHSQGLFLGSAAAAVIYLIEQYRSRRHVMRLGTSNQRSRRLFRLVSSVIVTAASFAMFVWLMVLWAQADTPNQSWLYNGGLSTAAIVGAGLLVTLVSPANQFSRLFRTNLLVEIGKISYTLFLVHLPVFWLVRLFSPGKSAFDVAVIGVPVALLMAGALHHLAAEPMRLRRWSGYGTVIFLVAATAVVSSAIFLPSMAIDARQSAGQTKILTLGDSLANGIASSLTNNIDDSSRVFNAVFSASGNCGLTGAESTRDVAGVEVHSPGACSEWASRWKGLVKRTKPDLILIDVSRDAMQQKFAGAWTDLTEAEFAGEYKTRLDELDQVFQDTTVPVFLTTSLLESPEANREQSLAFNTLISDFVAAHPRFHLLDVAAEFCRDGECPARESGSLALFEKERTVITDAGRTRMIPWLTTQFEKAQQNGG